MSEISKIVADIQNVFAESAYPDAFLESYDQMECLASHSGRETFLVRRKSDGLLAVAKCYDRTLFPFSPDFHLLESFDDPGIPRYLEQYQNEKTLCVIREYVEGIPLNRYFREKQPDLKEILDIADKLCSILSLLHGQTPPLIHRDIKPENIILRSDGEPVLIDFDISRSVREDSGTDTVSFGTRGYAPPEQYGFEQTDQKADIYAFGVLLRWMVSGSIRPNRNIQMDADLERVIDRCTAFSPEERYPDIESVRKALQGVGKNHSRLSGKTLIGLVLCSLLFGLMGFCLGRFTDMFRPMNEPIAEIVFNEPLIEKAVRLQLGVDENTLLTAEDLSTVTALYIYGTEAYAGPEEYYAQDKAFHQQGPIHSLNDLDLLPNLEMFFLVFQGQVNISALGRLENLSYVELKHMQLEDVYPLSECTRLRAAHLFDTGIRDVTALEACHWLESLDVGYNPIEDMAHIGVHPYVTSLTLRGNQMESLAGIEKFTSLRGLTLCQAEIADLTTLTAVPSLETVYITEDMAEQVTKLLAGTDITVIIQDN